MDTSFISMRALLPILFIVGCAGTPSEKRNGTGQPGDVKAAPETVTTHSVEGAFHFSSKDTKDRFRIRLLGPDTLTTQVSFEIITATNETIYQTTFSSMELIGFDAENTNTKSDEEKIIDGMNQFFSQDNFVTPAIDSPEYDPEDYTVIDRSVWNEIKDSGLTGFFYKRGEENMIWIVFLKSKNSVITYKGCC